MSSEFDTRDQRPSSMFLAEVVDNADPDGHDRVRLAIPGRTPKSAWAFPIGAMFGVKNGVRWVPEVGSNVVGWFLLGDVDHPYYMAGPWGAPEGVTDKPEQQDAGGTDVVVLRWRDMHFTFDGRDGAEKVTLQDLTTGTLLEIERPNGGDLTTDVENDRLETVARHRTSTIEGGNETLSVLQGNRAVTVAVGNDTETIGGNKTKSVTGNEVDSIAGTKTESVLGATSSETVPSGAKSITAGLAVNVVAGAAVNITAGAAVNVLGAGVNIQSAGGPMTQVSSGLMTSTFLGGITSTVVGAVARTITGTWTLTVTGVATLLATILNVGQGVVPNVSPGYRALLTEEFITWYLTHTHPITSAPGTSGAPTGSAIVGAGPIPDPSIVSPNVDKRTIVTAHLRGS